MPESTSTTSPQILPKSDNQQSSTEQNGLEFLPVNPDQLQSKLIIELPPSLEASSDTLPNALSQGINPLLSEIRWDPKTETLLLPSGLEIAEIETISGETEITLSDGTTIRIEGHSDTPPSIEIDNQTLTAQEIQQAFNAARNVEPGAGPEASSGLSSGSEPASGNNEPQSPLVRDGELTGSGNDFEPIPIVVQPSFPITPLLLPTERNQEFFERDESDGAFIEAKSPQIAIPEDPTINPAFFQGSDDDLYEAGLPTGSTPDQAATTTSGPLNISSGSSPLSLLEVCDPAQNIWIDVTGGGQITTPLGTFIITQNTDGSYSWSYILSATGDHSSSAVSEPLKLKLTNEDGAQASGEITINIIDDAPVIDIADAPASIAEGNTLDGTWSLNPGADGVTQITVSMTGEADQTVSLSGNANATFTLPKGTLTVNPDGTYSFEAATNLDNDDPQEQSFTLSATDADGDTTTDSHTITITDGTPPTPPDNLPGEAIDLILTINEAALDTNLDQADLAVGNTTGSDPTSTAETDVSSTLTFTAGSDDLSSFAFGDTSAISISNGDATLTVSWAISNGQLVGAINGTPAIILSLDATTITAGQQGTVTVTATLTDAFPHDASGEPLTITGIKLDASDHDGDTVTADIQVNIINDAPVIDIADAPASIAEGNTLYGTWSLNPGADGVTQITVSMTGEADQTVSLSGNANATFTLPKGTLTVNPDGTYSFEAATNLDNDDPQEQSFTLSATDADGDTTTDSHTITITDGPQPFGGDLIALSLEEGALGVQTGNDPATGSTIGSNPASTAETQSDTLAFTAGSDDITGFTLGDTSNILVQDDSNTTVTSILWSLSADKQVLTGSIAGQNVIQLTINGSSIAAGTTGTVQVTATLLAEFPHVTDGSSDFSILGVPIVATDTDGSTAIGITNISIKDDEPDIDITDTQNIVTEGDTITDTFSLSLGADGYSSVTVYTDVNNQYSVDLAPNSQTTLYTEEGQLTLHSDGTWEFTANTGLDFSQLQTLQFFISVEDGDGDKDADSHLISIKQAAQPIEGTAGNDVLTGTQTSELILGLEGDDTISGGGGRDKLAGMDGYDTLEGGAQSDTFVLDLTNLTIADLITDYISSGADADLLDATEMVGGEQIDQANAEDYFQLSGGILSFDQDGTGTNHSMEQVMNFSSPPAQVEIIIDESQAPVIITS
ncbi:calcium-binding protein [Pseudovibrio sp. Tun.PSC04-5.I4]|uniref:beta strand repeat-containing protein n=1 Tax=Pseudovibrio sp. Tun.PSC04-5.I4 TaxID=1798213 RepID=UPI00088AC59A|nr:calcium-binding protein [Pseudovibrio sp. Tun.PSC04-5.I4]SDR06629.1 Ca2+-binding protein, RTX toxin-related [Pseudovibrio sp. Tun.PSC04-5.I4]